MRMGKKEKCTVFALAIFLILFVLWRIQGYGKEKGINPYYRFFYKVDLDGSHFTLLTPGDGTHSIELSPDKKYLIDNYSRMDMPVVSQLVKIASPMTLSMTGLLAV